MKTYETFVTTGAITNDAAELFFTEEQDFRDFLAERELKKKWIPVKIYGVNFTTTAEGPLFTDITRDELKLGPEVHDEAINSNTTNMAVQLIDDDGTSKYYLLSDVALASLAQMLIGQTNMFKKLSPANKVEALKVFQTAVSDPDHGKKAIMLYSFGKARTFQIADKGNKTYSVMEQTELVDTLTKHLNENYEGYKFEKAYFNHNSTWVMYSLPEQAEDLMETYVKTCHAHGVSKVDDFVPAFIFETSDTGFSAANIKACLVNGSFQIDVGSPLRIDHMGGHTVNDFNDMLPKLFVQFKDLLVNLEKLLEIEVKHPVGCIRNLGADVGITPTFLDEAIEFFEITHDAGETITAHEIFFSLQETLLDMQNAKVAASTIEKCRENLTRCLAGSFSWSKFDHIA